MIPELDEPFPIDISNLSPGERARLSGILAQARGEAAAEEIRKRGEHAVALSTTIGELMSARSVAQRSGNKRLAADIQGRINQLRAERAAEHEAQNKLVAHLKHLNEVLQ